MASTAASPLAVVINVVLPDETCPADALVAEAIDQLEMLEAVVHGPDEEIVYTAAFARVIERVRRRLRLARLLMQHEAQGAVGG